MLFGRKQQDPRLLAKGRRLSCPTSNRRHDRPWPAAETDYQVWLSLPTRWVEVSLRVFIVSSSAQATLPPRRSQWTAAWLVCCSNAPYFDPRSQEVMSLAHSCEYSPVVAVLLAHCHIAMLSVRRLHEDSRARMFGVNSRFDSTQQTNVCTDCKMHRSA